MLGCAILLSMPMLASMLLDDLSKTLGSNVGLTMLAVLLKALKKGSFTDGAVVEGPAVATVSEVSNDSACPC